VKRIRRAAASLVSEYGVLLVLALLAAFFSLATIKEQHATGAAAGKRLAARIVQDLGSDPRILVAARATEEDSAFADALAAELEASGIPPVASVKGPPGEVRAALERRAAAGGLDVLACDPSTSGLLFVRRLREEFPVLDEATVVTPESYLWPDFLKLTNLRTIADQIAVIAIIAIGMTMVIITGGIDLSVGSLIALAAVVSTWLIRELAGAEGAAAPGMVLCSLGGIAACALAGGFSGAMVTVFSIPPFIVTLSMMLVARGLAFMITDGRSVHEVPDSFAWLGHGAVLLGIPNAVLLMLILYAAAHVVMTRMVLGRYIYAVGGNREAARLAAVPVKRVLLLVYTLCGALAGLGGVVRASQFESGAPTYAVMAELEVIAAVVVGGTSLMGGVGKIPGTLVGAFIIAVIQNGMGLMGVKSYPQQVVLGLVILGAVLLDTRLRRRTRG
jgi:ribose transport system permease protein